MSHQLREALHDLAAQAGTQPPCTPTPDELWERGRRARRRRLTASTITVSVLVAVLGAMVPLVGVELGGAVVPASNDRSNLAVPDQIWGPPAWTPTADGAHPPGPLALIASADRRGAWLVGSRPAWFGVSAVDQTYRWLEPPRQASSQEAGSLSLSPDGRKLAYFLGGAPSASAPQSDVVGFAVQDLVTGEVTERRFSTRYGLSAGELTWSGDSRWLVTSHGQYLRMLGASSFFEFEAWNPATGDVVRLRGLEDQQHLAPSPDGGVATWKGDRLLDLDPATGEATSRQVRAKYRSMTVPSAPVYSPDQSHVVFADGMPMPGQGERLATYVAPVLQTGEVGRPRVLDKTWGPHHVLGWLDDRTVLVETSSHEYGGLGPAPMRIRAYDVVDGRVATGMRRPSGESLGEQFQVATDLLLRPLVPGREPPLGTPPGPVAALLGLVVAALTGLVVLVVRRLRRGALAQLQDGGGR